MVSSTSAAVDPLISRLRPRSVPEILDQAFRMYRRHFLTFLAIIAVVHVPLQLLIQGLTISMMGNYYTISDFTEGTTGTNELLVGMLILYLAIMALSVVYWILQNVCQGALTVAIADSYMDRPVNFAGAYRGVLAKLWPLLGAVGLQLLIGIAIFLPAVLLMALSLVHIHETFCLRYS